MKRYIIHPLVLAAFPILSLYQQNADCVPLREVLLPLGIAVGLSILVWSLADRLLKHKAKSAAVASLLILIFFSYTRLMLTVARMLVGLHVLDPLNIPAVSRLWPFLLLAVFAAGVYAIIRSSSDLRLVTLFLNVMSVGLLVIVAIRWADAGLGRANSWQVRDAWPGVPHSGGTAGSSEPRSLPDIYYIILDGYGRGDVLQELHHYDNTSFLSFLTDLGFYVAEDSRANYCWTPLSLASSLNSTYLGGEASTGGEGALDMRVLRKMIKDSRVVALLRGLGYRITAFSSGHSPTELTSADQYLAPPGNLTAFQMEVVNSTPLYLLLRLPFLPSLYDLHRERILFTLDHLASADRDDSPTFVFAHIVAPHPPYVFGPEGEPIEPDAAHTLGLFCLQQLEIAPQAERSGSYTDQLTYINRKVQAAITQILSRSSRPPIIILQADHGPGDVLGWEAMTGSALRERMSILNAYYFPGQEYGTLYESITPVNTFRVVANLHYGTSHQLLQDRSYYSSNNDLFGFIEVPERVWESH